VISWSGPALGYQSLDWLALRTPPLKAVFRDHATRAQSNAVLAPESASMSSARHPPSGYSPSELVVGGFVGRSNFLSQHLCGVITV